MSDTFEVISDRPNVKSRGVQASPLSIAVAETARTGGAVKFALNGEQSHTVRVRLAAFCRTRGLRVRMWTQEGVCTVWAEQKDATD